MSDLPASSASKPRFDLSALGYAIPAKRLDVFRRLFVLKIAIFDGMDALYGQTVPITQQGVLPLAVALLTPVAAVLAFRDRTARVGLYGLALLRLAGIGLTLPYTINHLFLEFVLLLGLALSFEAPAGEARASESVFTIRWAQALFLSVWFYAGLQKLVHGYYLSGELFGLEGLSDDRGLTPGLSGTVITLLNAGCALFGGTVPHVSAAALTDRVDLALAPWMPIFLRGLCSFIVLAELSIPPLFAWPRARRAAVVALACAQVGIAISSMEIDFAIDNFLFLILLWPSSTAVAPGSPPLAAGRHYRAISSAVVLSWPLLHMALAMTLGFSSWRFFGWGMYATPDLWRIPAVYTEAADHSLTPLAAPADAPEVFDAYKPLHYFGRAASVAHFGEVYAAAAGQPGADPLVVVIVTPRLNLSERALYTADRVYRVHSGVADELGSFSTLHADYQTSLRGVLGHP